MFNATEEIKSRLDIVEFIQQYVRLEKSGINWRANCPFHQERTPSFFVSKARQRWHCFGGCAEGGDIFSFLMKIEGLEFPEALATLAKRAGVEITREDPRIQSERNRMYAICEAAAEWFAGELQRSASATEYLLGRGLQEKTIADFRIGWAPDGWRNLLEHLTAKGFKPDDIEKAGLAILRQPTTNHQQLTTQYYDRFRSRIVFPISDANGRVIAFGGRIFEFGGTGQDDKIDKNVAQNNFIKRSDSSSSSDSSFSSPPAKYINSPQTPIYDKSRTLYAFDKAKQPIREKNSCILVEGYMDAVMSHQAGIANAVAVSGTALTDWQLRAIRRLTDTVISSFDSDSAGEKAAKRSLDLASSNSEFGDFKRLVAVIPSAEGKDPADIVVKNPERWREIVAGAGPVLDYYFKTACAKHDAKSVDGKKAIAVEFIPQLALLANEIEQSHWVHRLEGELSVSEQSIWNELEKFKVREGNAAYVPFEDTPAKIRERSRVEELEARLVGALLLWPEKASLLVGTPAMGKDFFSSAFHGTLFEALKEGKPVGVGANVTSGQGTEGAMQDLMLRAEVAFQDVEKKDAEIVLCAHELYKERMRGRLSELSQKIKDAERNREAANLENLTREFQEVSKRLG